VQLGEQPFVPLHLEEGHHALPSAGMSGGGSAVNVS
jgi:hypothetical protein